MVFTDGKNAPETNGFNRKTDLHEPARLPRLIRLDTGVTLVAGHAGHFIGGKCHFHAHHGSQPDHSKRVESAKVTDQSPGNAERDRQDHPSPARSGF